MLESGSVNIERGKVFLEQLSDDQVLLLHNVLRFNIKVIAWDLDLILPQTRNPLQAKPVKEMRSYSLEANRLSKKQFVVTSKGPELADSTAKCMDLHYPWIPLDNVFIRAYRTGITGETFKAEKLFEIEPDVHFESSIVSAQKILQQTNIPFLLFPRTKGARTLTDKRLVEFQDMEVWADYIVAYSEPLVAQY